MYRLLQDPSELRVPTEAPAKAGVWGWVKFVNAAKGRECAAVECENPSQDLY